MAEFWAEWPLFKTRAFVIIAGLVFQYIHAIFTGMACERGRAMCITCVRVHPCAGCCPSGTAFCCNAQNATLAQLQDPRMRRRRPAHSVRHCTAAAASPLAPVLCPQHWRPYPRLPADYMHTPLPVDNTTLHDLGFEALPFLDVDAVSEVMVYCGGCWPRGHGMMVWVWCVRS